MKIETKLNLWAANGIISETQKAQILTFEQSHKKNYVLWGFLSIGILAIGCGIISLIAYNWILIPNVLKLTAIFLLLAVNVYGIARADAKKQTLAYEALLFLYFILTLAAIGVIAQVYNLHSTPHRGYLFWVIITLPLTLLSQKKVIPFVWLPVLLITAGMELAMYAPILRFLTKFTREAFFFIPIFAVAGFIIMNRLLKKLSPNLSFVFNFYTLIALLFLIALFDGSVALGGMNDLFYLIPSPYLCERFGHDSNACNNISWQHYIISLPLVAVAHWIIFASLRVAGNKQNTILIYLSALITCTLFILAVSPLQTTLWSIYEAVATILTLFVLSLYILICGQTKLFNLLTFLIGLRFIFIYFQLFGNLATTGIGLIIAGGLIIAFVYGWNKNRSRLFKKMTELIS